MSTKLGNHMAPNALNFVPFIGESTALEIQYVCIHLLLPLASYVIKVDPPHQKRPISSAN